MTISQPEQVQADSVFALAASADTLYAGRISGIFRSRDDGAAWQDVFPSRSGSDRFAVTALAAAGLTVFAGAAGAVLRSDDGTNWQTSALASPPPTLVARAPDPHYEQDGIVVAATTDDGIFVSDDRGAAWIPWNFGLVDAHVNALAFSPDFRADRAIFAGTESGIFRSDNAGRSWREVPFPMTDAPVLSLALAPTYAADRRLYAGTERHGLFISDDAGQTWQQVAGLAAGSINALQLAGAAVWLLLDDALVCLDGREQSALRPLPAGKQPLALLWHHGAALVGFADGDILRLP